MVGVDIVFLVSLVVGIDHSLKILMTDTPNFISTYDNVLSSEECKQIIYEFEDSKEKQVEG